MGDLPVEQFLKAFASRALAAGIVRTAIAPAWTDIGMLGAIAVIRTFLDGFLSHDRERLRTDGEAAHG